MAITGTKLFASGDVLTANDTNQYLMRGVKVYSSTAVRDAAYGGAGEPTLEEGETCYITADDELQTYNGSSWVKIGPSSTPKILQLISTTKTDTYTHSSGITFTNVTGLSAAITPSQVSSKVLIMVDVNVGGNNGGTYVKVTGGNAASWVGASPSNRTAAALAVPAIGANQMQVAAGYYLDSPATTSAITYQVQIAASNNVTTTYVNRSADDTDNNQHPRSTSTITVMEVSA